MSKKQTAVDWLINELTNKQNGNGSNNSIDEIYNQALQMEREQIEEAFRDGWDNNADNLNTPESTYYTQTYGECTQQ